MTGADNSDLLDVALGKINPTMKKIPETDTMSRLNLSVKGWKGSGFPEMGFTLSFREYLASNWGRSSSFLKHTHHITLERLAWRSFHRSHGWFSSNIDVQHHHLFWLGMMMSIQRLLTWAEWVNMRHFNASTWDIYTFHNMIVKYRRYCIRQQFSNFSGQLLHLIKSHHPSIT